MFATKSSVGVSIEGLLAWFKRLTEPEEDREQWNAPCGWIGKRTGSAQVLIRILSDLAAGVTYVFARGRSKNAPANEKSAENSADFDKS